MVTEYILDLYLIVLNMCPIAFKRLNGEGRRENEIILQVGRCDNSGLTHWYLVHP